MQTRAQHQHQQQERGTNNGSLIGDRGTVPDQPTAEGVKRGGDLSQLAAEQWNNNSQCFDFFHIKIHSLP